MKRVVFVSLCLGAAVAGGCATWGRERQGDTTVARKRLARELIARQDWSAAFFYADELHRQRPDDAEVLVLRGTIYRERRLPAEAEADLGEALRLDRKSAEGHSAMAVLYDTTSRGDRAEEHHRRANELAPKDAGYLNNWGFSLFLRGKYKEAIEVYQRAVRLAPTSGRIRVNLGYAYAASGDLPRAAKEFEMGGTAAEAKNNIGFAYERRGDLAHAFELYLEALRLDPKLLRARANLTHVAQKLGREIPAEARSE